MKYLNYKEPRFSLLFLANILTLWFFSLFAFTRNSGRLLTGLDGPTLIATQEQQLSFFGMTAHLHSNILQGLGNTYINNLTFFPSVFNHFGIYSPVILYSSFAVVLFISVLLIGWNYGFSKRVSFVAAWLLTILFLPYFQEFRIYNITETAPNMVLQIFIFVLMDIAIFRMGRENWYKTLGYGGFLLATVILGFILSPVVFILIAPVLLFTTLHAFLKTKTRAEFLRKFIMGGIIVSIIIMSGWVHFLAGLILNTAANVFNTDIKEGYHTLIYVSILFQRYVPSSTWGPWLFWSAVIGTLLAIYRSSQLRLLGRFILLTQLSIVGGGALVMALSEKGLGPPPIYFEVMLFPFYALFTIYLFSVFFEKISFLQKYFHKIDLISPFAVVSILGIVLFFNPPRLDRLTSYALPPTATTITDILEKEIAVHPNSVFSGRVANILPDKDWLAQCSYFLALNGLTGNDHQSSGLWLKSIPTLHEYNQGITPGFYKIYRRFLATASEPVNRNWSSFSKVDLKILRLLGVRFIISPISEIKNTKVRTELQIPEWGSIFLHELSDANISGISARSILTATNVSEAEKLMSANYFNLSDAVIITQNTIKTTHLLPAKNKKLSIEKGGFRLQAESKGKTLLLLPIEFSHCLHVKSLSGASPKIVRVDIALTGVFFDRHVDILLDNRTGPFARPLCKFDDYREFKRLLA